MRRETRTLYIIAAIAVVVLAVIYLWKPSLVGGPAASPTPAPGAKKSPAPGGSPLPESYNQALVTYANRRIQFDQYCQANPSRLSLNNGTNVMFDNRSGDARTFAVDGQYFTLAGYGWKIVKVSSSTLPKTLYIDCGSAQNVGQIILQ